jgi:hypothetical protein
MSLRVWMVQQSPPTPTITTASGRALDLLPLGLATAFMIPGLLGFSWLLGGRWIYHSPTNHPRISEGERWEDLKPPSVGREQQKRLPINVIDDGGGKEHSADPPA